jgi:hypothetical protein
VAVDADALTVILANRLGKIVPAGFHVEAHEGMLSYAADPGVFPGQGGDYGVGTSGTFVRDNLEAHGEDAEVGILRVAMQALDELQDYVDEATHEPWPGRKTPPKAYAQVRGAVLHLWYGGANITDEVVLACEPISLADVRTAVPNGRRP